MVEQDEPTMPVGPLAEVKPGSGTAPAAKALDADERSELLLLRQENADLRSARERRRQVPWRAFASAVLVVLGVMLAPIAVASIWAHNQIADTDRFVATAGPLAEDPAVRSALTERLTDTVFTYVDVTALTDQAVDALQSRGLPPQTSERLRGLAGPLRSSLEGFVHDRVGQFVASPTFVQLWNRSLTLVHQRLNAVLSGNSSAVTVSQGKVMLDLGPFIDRVKQRLVAQGFAPANAIPSVHPTVAVADASTLVRAQTGYRLLDKVATWLPWLALLFLAAGIYLARGHRKALRNAGIGVAFSMVVLGAVLLVARGAVVGTVPERSTAAVASSFDIMVAFLRAGLRTMFVVGIVVAIGAALFGPSTTSVRVRAGAVSAVGWLRERIPVGGRAGGPVEAWVHTYRVPLRISVLVIAVLVFLFLDQPSAATVIVIAAILLVCLGVIQFLDWPATKGPPAGTPPTPGEPTPRGG